jgi:hypothetical protein
MISRRSAMKIGTAMVVNLPILGRNVEPARAYSAFHRAVFDERFAECRAFAAELHGAGALTSSIRGDVADLWYGDLRAHLSENRLPIAGLTDRAALFCLEELSRDVGMRVIFRADHIIDQNGHTRHTAVGPAPLVAATHSLPPEAEFGSAMAGLLTRFDVIRFHSSGPDYTAAQKRTGPFSPGNKTTLASRVIA